MPKPLRELNGRPEIASPGQLKWQKKEKLGIRLCLVNASRLVKFHEWTPQRNWRSQKVKKVELGEEQQPHVKSHMKSQCTEIEASSSWPVKWVENRKIARSQPRNRQTLPRVRPSSSRVHPSHLHPITVDEWKAFCFAFAAISESRGKWKSGKTPADVAVVVK